MTKYQTEVVDLYKGREGGKKGAIIKGHVRRAWLARGMALNGEHVWAAPLLLRKERGDVGLMHMHVNADTHACVMSAFLLFSLVCLHFIYITLCFHCLFSFKILKSPRFRDMYRIKSF